MIRKSRLILCSEDLSAGRVFTSEQIAPVVEGTTARDVPSGGPGDAVHPMPTTDPDRSQCPVVTSPPVQIDPTSVPLQSSRPSVSRTHEEGEPTCNGTSLPVVVGPTTLPSSPVVIADAHQDTLDPVTLRYGTTAYGWGDDDIEGPNNATYELPGALFILGDGQI